MVISMVDPGTFETLAQARFPWSKRSESVEWRIFSCQAGRRLFLVLRQCTELTELNVDAGKVTAYVGIVGTMVKYFSCIGLLKSSWDQVFIAFWQRYPNPYSNHVLTEDIVFREVTPENRLISRRLLTKTSRAPRWAERYLPVQMSRCAYIMEDSIVDPQARTMTTMTWNISHARLMSVEERCVYRVNPENGGWTHIKREAWISSSLYGLSRAFQEFGLARFKSSVTKTMKGFEYVLAKMQGETPSRTLVETAKEAKEKARETALAAKEKAKGLASQAQKKQFV